ncbi:MAG: SCO6880 family protein [Dietzia maris]
MSETMAPQTETTTYTLGRKRERNFIGRIPVRTAVVGFAGLMAFVVAMLAQQVRFALVAALLAVLVGALVHFHRDGRSFVTSGRLVAAHVWRRITGENLYLSGPESRVPGGQRRAPGLLAGTELLEDVDANGYRFGVIVNPAAQQVTVKLTGQLSGDVLRSVSEAEATTAQWGTCEAQWAHNRNLLAVVARHTTRPSTGMLALREVETLDSPEAPGLAREIQFERARMLQSGGQDYEFELAFTLKVSVSHSRDRRFLDQLRYEVGAFYRGPLPWAGIKARPMTADEIVASTHKAFNPAAEEDFEELHIKGVPHHLPWSDAGPAVAKATARGYFHDGTWSRTWEMVSAPPATFENKHLRPLLEQHSRITRKTVCLVYRPFPPGVAHSLVEAEHRDAMVGVNDGKTIKSVDAELRLEGTTASRKALAKGAGYGRRSMYVSVTWLPGEDDRAIDGDVEALANQLNIRVREMRLMQDSAFSFCLGAGALPFGRKD